METYGFDTTKAEAFPPMVQLTINNVCQLDCQHCPQQVYAKSEYNDRSRMTIALFRKIVLEMQQYPHSALRIFSRGEPLLHPDIVEMVRIAKHEAGLRVVSLITNGMLLQGNLAVGLIQNGLDLVEVSLDALTEETYRQIRPLAGQRAREQKSPFNTVVANIVNYAQLRDQLNSSCKIAVSIVDQPLVENEIEEFNATWQQRVDSVLKRTFHSFQGRVAGISVPEKRHPCRVLWARFNVHSNGNIPLCYNDWKNEEIIGNLGDPNTTIAGLWAHPTYRHYRESHLKGHYPGICGSCRDWTGLSWTNPYEKVILNIIQNGASKK